MESDTVWRALASTHRRHILDLLRKGPRTTGEIAREIPSLSRFAVMQHLGVLEEAKLVLFRREGRRRLNYANAIPLREIYERWVSPPASSAAEADLHLKRYAERKEQEFPRMQNSEFRLIKIESELRVKAPVEKVFAAFTDEYDDWWPHRYQAASRCSVDARPGGFVYEHFPNGGGAITGTIVYIDPPTKIVSSGPSSLARGIDSYSVQSFEPDGDGGTVMKRTMEIWGKISEETERMFREGSRHLMEVALREFLEQGVRYTVEAAR